MNRNGKLKTWGDADFARKLVEFANIEVIPNPGGLAGVLGKLHEVFGAAALHLLGHGRARGLLAGRDRQGHRGPRPRASASRRSRSSSGGRPPRRTARTWRRRSWAARAATRGPHRATRPRASSYKLPRPASFNEADSPDKPSNMTQRRADDDRRADPAAAARLRGPDRLAARRRRPREAARQDPALHAPAEEHADRLPLRQRLAAGPASRSPGDKYLPYEESLRIPFILRGPGVPAGRTVRGQVVEHRLRARRCWTRRERKARRTMDGVSLLPDGPQPAASGRSG